RTSRPTYGLTPRPTQRPMRPSLDRHLTGPELVRLSEPGLLDTTKARLAPDAATRAHLRNCAECRDRLDALRGEEDALAAALADFDAESTAPEERVRLDALADRMMTRLRDDVNDGVVPIDTSVAGDDGVRSIDRYPSRRPRAMRARLWSWGAGV